MNEIISTNKFYYNKFIVLFWYLYLVLSFAFGIYIINKCFIIGVLLCCGIAFFMFLMYEKLFTHKPFLIIDSVGITYYDDEIIWSKIKSITFGKARTRSAVPCLALQIKEYEHLIYRYINLNFLSDSTRRKLLDCIEKYQPIHYDQAKYTTNYTLISTIFITLLTLFMICAVYVNYELS